MNQIDKNRLAERLMKPLPNCTEDIGDPRFFDPWEDVIQGIYGNYSSECDMLFIEALKAVRDRKTFELIEKHRFSAELVLYILAGHGLTEYGTSPRGSWPDPSLVHLWDALIKKWEAYAAVYWCLIRPPKNRA